MNLLYHCDSCDYAAQYKETFKGHMKKKHGTIFQQDQVEAYLFTADQDIKKEDLEDSFTAPSDVMLSLWKNKVKEE